MSRKENNALIPRAGTAISKGTERRASQVIKRMTQDVLARARRNALGQARFRLGDYEFREPDYRQILDWADALDLKPETVLEHLATTTKTELDFYEEFESVLFDVVDGGIRTLVWDFDQLGPSPSQWRDGLSIEKLAWVGSCPEISALAPKLLSLKTMVCTGVISQLTELDLSSLPGLTELYCGRNHLTELDLSPVPGLTKLHCGSMGVGDGTSLDLSPVPGLTELICSVNQLMELDLSPVPGLTKLDCWGNLLTSLDLSSIPGLTNLRCGGNLLTELDLSSVPRLTALRCEYNQLKELDLSPVPGLTELHCGGNLLAELDLSSVPRLTALRCEYNQLKELDLLSIPGLTELQCTGNGLAKLDLSSVPGLTELRCEYNQLKELDLSPVPGLTELECGNNHLKELDLSPVPGLTWLACDDDVSIYNAPIGLECVGGTIVSYADNKSDFSAESDDDGPF